MKSLLPVRLRQLVAKLTSTEGPLSPADRRSGLDLSIKVMSLVSVADGVVDESEVRLVQSVYAEQAGPLIEAATIERAFRITAEDRDSIWAELSRSHRLGPAVRSEVFRAAVDVAAADGTLHADEIALLERIGTALGISAREIEESLKRTT